MKVFALGAVLALAGCQWSNEGSRPSAVHDLASYGMSVGKEVVAGPYFLGRPGGSRPVSTGSWYFPGRDGTWSAKGGGWSPTRGSPSPIVFTEVDASGAPLASVTFDLKSLGYDFYSFVQAVTGDGDDRAWILMFADWQYSELIAVDLTTGAETARLGAPSGDFASGLAYASGRLYVVQSASMHVTSAVALDAATGAVLQDYPSIVRALSSASDTLDGVAVTSTRLFARLAGHDALVFDVADGRPLGEIGGVASGAMASDGDRLLVEQSIGRLSVIDVSPSPLPDLPVRDIRVLEHGGVIAITSAQGIVWILYSDGSRAQIVGYDPATFQPVEGFALDESTAASVFDPTKVMGPPGPTALSSSDDAFYLIASSQQGEASRIHVLDYATGELRSMFDVVGVEVSDVCFSEGSLWAIELRRSAGYFSGEPRLYELDPANGLSRRSLGSGVQIAGAASVLCTAGGLVITGDGTRALARIDPDAATDPVYRALPLATTGASGVEVNGALWLVDRARNLVFVTDSF